MPLIIGTLERFGDYLSNYGSNSRFFRSPVVSSLFIATSSAEFIEDGLRTAAFPFILDPLFTQPTKTDIDDDWVSVEPHLRAREIAAAVTRAIQRTNQLELINADWPKLTGEQRYVQEVTREAAEVAIAWYKARSGARPEELKKPLQIERSPDWGIF